MKSHTSKYPGKYSVYNLYGYIILDCNDPLLISGNVLMEIMPYLLTDKDNMQIFLLAFCICNCYCQNNKNSIHTFYTLHLNVSCHIDHDIRHVTARKSLVVSEVLVKLRWNSCWSLSLMFMSFAFIVCFPPLPFL